MTGRIKISSGKIGIWSDASDELPFTTPLSYLNRVKFHSDLAYIGVVSTITTTISLPSFSSGPERVASYNITPSGHGQSGFPFVIGKAVIGGHDIGFTGSVCVQKNESGAASDTYECYGRFLALGADDTNVYVHEYAVCSNGPTVWYGYSALDVDIVCYITDRILEASP